MAFSRLPSHHDFLDAQGATGVGTAIDVSYYQHVTVAIASDNSANLIVQCQSSVSSTEPTLGSAAALDNEWSYTQMTDVEDATVILVGDTGVVFSGADDVILATVDVSGVKWLNFRVTAHSAGDVTVRGFFVNNQ